jgi:hypothetical protein
MRRVCLTVMAALTSVLLVAQEKKTDVSINLKVDGGGSFWGSSVMWIFVVAVFITVLVAVFLGRIRQ